MDGTAARVGAWSRRVRRARSANPDRRRTQGDGSRHTGNGRLCIERRQQGGVRPAMNRATGALELIEKTPVPGTDKPSPASLPMATSPDKHFLYAQLRSEPYPVSTFAIDRTTGRLKHLR